MLSTLPFTVKRFGSVSRVVNLVRVCQRIHGVRWNGIGIRIKGAESNRINFRGTHPESKVGLDWKPIRIYKMPGKSTFSELCTSKVAYRKKST